MKTKLLLILTFCVAAVFGFGQTLFIPAPVNNGATTGLRAPNGTAAQTTLRAHFIIPASELTSIPSGTVITDLGVNLDAGAVGTASGNLEFYLENTADVTNNKSVDWGVATSPMSNVFSGTFAIPTVAGTSDFTLTNTFTYTGGGLYVAYEYVGATFATTGAVYLAENTLPNSCRTGATATATPLDSLDGVSAWRPEVRFGFANPFTNNLSVDDVFADFGVVNKYLQNDSEIKVLVNNLGSVGQTNVPVTLSVSGATTYSNVQTIANIGSGGTATVTFSNVPADATGTNIIQVILPSDQQTSNDTIVFLQAVTCDSIGLSSTSAPTGAVGFNTGTGILAARYDIPAGQPANVKTVDIVVGNNTESVGNSIKGVLLNSAGVIVDSSALYTITSGDILQGVSLPLLNGNVTYAGQTVFAGIRQTANTSLGYFPVGMQNKFEQPIDQYAAFGVNGGAPNYQNTLDPFMISLTVTPLPVFTLNANNVNPVCPGAPVSIATIPASFDNYTIFGNNSQLATNTIGLFNVNPMITTTYEVDVEKNGCTYTSLPTTVTVVSEFTTTQTESICLGESFEFDGQNLTADGQYSATFTAVGGCDSIVTLNLSVLQASTATLNESICNGDSYDFFGQTINTAGTYTDVIPNAAGCDSTITLNLDVLLADVSVSQVGATLTAAAAGPNVTYQWIDCDNNSAIPGATGQTFTPTDDMGITGNYAVEITAGNCFETSPCTVIDFTNVADFSDEKLILFPNPVVNELFVQSSLKEVSQYRIMDITGRIIQSASLSQSELIKIDVSALAKGTYVLELQASGKAINTTFVK